MAGKTKKSRWSLFVVLDLDRAPILLLLRDGHIASRLVFGICDTGGKTALSIVVLSHDGSDVRNCRPQCIMTRVRWIRIEWIWILVEEQVLCNGRETMGKKAQQFEKFYIGRHDG